MKVRCITNNPMIIKKGSPVVEAFNVHPLNLYKLVKDEILKGYKLITHPLTGSIRPDISPYKSVVLNSNPGVVDMTSLNIIENAISYTEHLMAGNSIPHWDEASLQDFQLIDLDFVKDLI